MTSSDPFISIIIPVYNRDKLIIETLQSVKAQSYSNWEAIVVDDHSTDRTYEVVKSFCDSESRIKLFKRNREPKGAPTCRNIGIKNSDGQFIIFLDSDDLLAENCLSDRVAEYKLFPDYDFLVFQSALFENKPEDYNRLWNIDSDEDDLNRFLRIDALWPICGPIYKRKTIVDVGGFKEHLTFYQDYDLHLRLLFLKYNYKKFLNKEPDIFIRHHFNDSVSNSIAFTSDTSILQKRIDFFLHHLQFVNDYKIKLNSDQKYTIWNILFYFCSRFIIEHSDRKAYQKNWFKVRKLLGISLWKHNIAYMEPVLTSFQKKNRLFIKIKSLYSSYFKKYLADESVILNTTLMKQLIINKNGTK